MPFDSYEVENSDNGSLGTIDPSLLTYYPSAELSLDRTVQWSVNTHNEETARPPTAEASIAETYTSPGTTYEDPGECPLPGPSLPDEATAAGHDDRRPSSDELWSQALEAFRLWSVGEHGSAESAEASLERAQAATMAWWTHWHKQYTAIAKASPLNLGNAWQKKHRWVMSRMAPRKTTGPPSKKAWVDVLNHVRDSHCFRSCRVLGVDYVMHHSRITWRSHGSKIDCFRIATMSVEDAHLKTEVWRAFSKLGREGRWDISREHRSADDSVPSA